MKSSIPNTQPATSRKLLTAESGDKADLANRDLADRLIKTAVEGLNRLSRETLRKNPRQAA